MFYIFLFKNKENIFVFFRCFIPLCILLLEKCRENVSFLSVGTPFPIGVSVPRERGK